VDSVSLLAPALGLPFRAAAQIERDPSVLSAAVARSGGARLVVELARFGLHLFVDLVSALGSADLLSSGSCRSALVDFLLGHAAALILFLLARAALNFLIWFFHVRREFDEIIMRRRDLL
jgi:hypothetical protein